MSGTDTAEPAAGSVVAGKYRLISPLGSGAMGAVWRSEHVALGAPVALKLIHRAFLDGPQAHEMARRFAREARAVAAVRGPHVVQILDYGVDDGMPYIALELLEGEGLDVLLKEKKRLSPKETARYVSHVARALTRAREVGYIHRDLKPSNIFIVDSDGTKIAKVLDFGLTKALGGGGLGADITTTALTEAGRLLGTPYYMSPEQVRGRELDERTDVWSLSVIAFECITGARPFSGASLADLMMDICGSAPIRFTDVDRNLPEALDVWLARALERDIAKRFQTARELADALTAVADEHPPATQRMEVTDLAADTTRSPIVDEAVESKASSEPTEELDTGGLFETSDSGRKEKWELPNLYESVLDLEDFAKFWQGIGPGESHVPSSRPVKLGERVYLLLDGAHVGPIMMLEVVQALREGRIGLDTPVRFPGTSVWKGKLSELRLVGEGGRAIDLLDVEGTQKTVPRPPRGAEEVRAASKDEPPTQAPSPATPKAALASPPTASPPTASPPTRRAPTSMAAKASWLVFAAIAILLAVVIVIALQLR